MAIRPAANQAWFTFEIEGDRFSGLSVYEFTGKEQLNTPFEFHIELVNRDSQFDLSGALGKEGLLKIYDRSGDERLVHGVIRETEQLHTANEFTHYRCVLVPRFWFLGLTQDHKIYQNMDVTQIIREILKKHAFVSESYSFQLSQTYQTREYCVQYAESDLYFIDRLCEEEGIVYFFEHSESGHRLCFTDNPGGPAIPGESSLRFFPGSGAVADTAVVSRLNYKHRINSDTSTYRDWNFTTPKLDLTSNERETNWSKAPVPTAMTLETYQFPHLYQVTPEGERYVNIQLQRQLTFREWIECESDVSRYLPGFTFSLHSHQREEANKAWFIVSVEQKGKQATVLEHESPDSRGHEYIASFIAIPESTRFVPDIAHPKMKIVGQQSAVVTGPGGEEIYPDRFGRVKVQFHWDRFGQGDEHTSCWVRVSQGWAGGQYGMTALPRIGHEVLVSFMEGDPDRPVITGRVHHAENMPPYSLPEHKTRTLIKTKTVHGDGFNEIRLEDLKGNEQVFVHAQYDLDVIALNDRREWIKGERHLTVEKEKIEYAKGLLSSQTDADRIEATAQKRTVTVGEDEAHQVGGSLHQKVEKNVFIEGMTSGVIEMHEDLTIKAPGGFIRIDKQGVTIMGKVVNINSGGSPGNGFPVQAVQARAAMLADARDSSSGKAGTVKGAQKDPQTTAKSADAGAQPSDAGISFGEQSFVSSPVDPSALSAAAGASAAMASAAFTQLQNGPEDAELLMLSNSPQAREWRKTVLAGRMEQTTAGKIDLVNDHFSKHVTVTDTPVSEAGGVNKVVSSGKGSDLETAVAKYQTLSECGVPDDSMSVVVTNDTAFVAIQDQGQLLIAEATPPPGLPCKTAAAFVPPASPDYGINPDSVLRYSTGAGQ